MKTFQLSTQILGSLLGLVRSYYCQENIDDTEGIDFLTGTREDKVLKRAHTPHDFQLWNDYEMHLLVLAHVPSVALYEGLSLHVPKVHHFLTRDSVGWWDTNLSRWKTPVLREPNHLLEMDRIFSLPKVVRDILIDEFCPAPKSTREVGFKESRLLGEGSAP